MGTRADFYVGRGSNAEWIGSITWDGYPGGIADSVFLAGDEAGYRQAVATFFASRKDVTHPDEPWPWPWEDSRTTDYAYAWDTDGVYGSSFGYTWFRVDPDAENHGEVESSRKEAEFPNMAARKGSMDHIMGRSGLITFGPEGPGSPSTFGLSDPATVESASDGN